MSELNGSYAVAYSHFNEGAASNLLLVCEHASNFIPPEFHDLGLAHEPRQSHVAWDIGAAEFAEKLAIMLDANLLKASISRLVYDCNRSPEAVDAIPEKSEIVEIPGNKNLSELSRQIRIETVYRPFRAYLTELARNSQSLITIHSFTPIYNGQTRSVEIGVLHDSDSRLADKILHHASQMINMDIRRNEPYAPSDGVTHTLQVHGLANGIPNVMLEIRNDILSDAKRADDLAEKLAAVIQASLADLEQTSVEVQ